MKLLHTILIAAMDFGYGWSYHCWTSDPCALSSFGVSSSSLEVCGIYTDSPSDIISKNQYCFS